MNKNIHRIIFNTARGQWMAVPEHAAAHGKSDPAAGAVAAGPAASAFLGRLSLLKLSLLLCFGMASLAASAQIVPDAGAPGAQKPIVQNGANGVPVVNIQTPSAAGVSRNTYQQFDVKANGVVLNNAAGNVQSQLAGWIQGNPLLAGGGARVILNEVNSANPSLLHGFIEVAGARAQVIVANPAGISCDGCGFINADRATLTTGTPVFRDGNLESFRVERGTVSFSGAGMDASQTDYTRVLARAVQANAGIWAKQLDVVAGANEVRAEADGTQAPGEGVTPLAASGEAPAFSIDVAALGGMYAGKIRLVGTEAGLGVRNAGTLGATAGNVAIDAEGRISNAGSLLASGRADLAGKGGLSNSGTLYAGDAMDLRIAGSIDNTGLIGAANDLAISARADAAGQAGSVSNAAGATLAAGLAADMTLTQHGTLSVSADRVSAAGQLAAGSAQNWTGRDLSLQGASLLSRDFTLSAVTASLDAATLNSQGSVRLTASDSLSTRGASLQAGRMALAADHLDNTRGQLVQTGAEAFSLDLAGALHNESGLIATGGRFDLRADAIDNHDGRLQATGALSVRAAQLDNRKGSVQSGASLSAEIARGIDGAGGLIAANGDLRVSAGAGLDNTGGQIVQNGAGTLALATGAGLDNHAGVIASAGTVDLTTASLRNDGQGQIIADGAVTLRAGTLTNATGTLQSGGRLEARVDGALDNAGGAITARNGTTLTAGSVDNTQGRIVSLDQGSLTLDAGQSLDNRGGTLAGQGGAELRAARLENGAGGQISFAGPFALHADAVSNAGGVLRSDAGLDLSVRGALDNTAGALYAGGALVLSAEGRLANERGSILSAGSDGMTLTLGGALSNAGGRVSANGGLDLKATAVDNTAGGELGAGGALTVEATTLDNTAGRVQADQSLRVRTTGAVTNQGGNLIAGSGLAIEAGGVGNAAGRIFSTGGGSVTLQGGGVTNAGGTISGGAVALDTHGGALDNTAGTIVAASSLDISSARLDNTGGTLQAAGDLRADTHGAELINRDSGSQHGILAGGELTLHSGAFDNRAGFIGGNRGATLTTTGFDNTAGTLNAQQALAVTTGTFSNASGGQVNALGDLTVRASALHNAGGLLRANQTLDIATGYLDNRATQAGERGLAGASVLLATTTLDNTGGAIRADQALTLSSSGTLDNTAGLIQSAGQTTLQDTQAQRTLNVTNQGGNILAGRALRFQTGRYGGNGTLASYGDLDFSVQGDYTHTGVMQGLGNVTVTVQNAFRNESLLEAGQTLNLRAASIDNALTGELNGGTTHLYSDGVLTNRGLIDGGLTWLESGGLNNLGSGRIYGDQVAIRTGSLRNAAEAGADGQTRAAVIAARGSLQIGAITLDNSEHAMLFSADRLALGAGLDANLQASGQADTLSNRSATIESLGDMALSARQILNRNEHFATEQVQVSSEYHDIYTVDGLVFTAKDDGAEVRQNNNQSNLWVGGNRITTEFDRRYFTETITETRVTQTDPAVIRAGGALALSSDALLNDKSKLLAGGVMTGSLNAITNDGGVGQRITTHTGTFAQYRNGSINYSPYNKAEEGGMDLGAVVVAAYSGQGGSGTSVAARQGVGLTGGVAALGGMTLGRDGQGSESGAQAPGRTAVASQIYEVSAGEGKVIRSTLPNLTLPDNSLFKLNLTLPGNPAAHGNYLIETDPRFADYRTWLSSDAMLTALGMDPALTLKRLGDGFYEQKLIREQISELTGRRFLDGYASDEAQYQALMDNGVSFAKAHQLIPGVALSAEQMALLTSDIVWLVEQPVTLPDGSVTRALVPQVYARAQSGDIDGSGALIAARDVQIQISGSFANNGTLAASRSLALTADSISQTGGRMDANALALHTTNDIVHSGGLISGTQSVVLDAGRNVVIASSSGSGANDTVANTYVSRLAGVQVGRDGQEGGQLVISGRQDVALTAATIANLGAGGSTLIAAGRDLTVGTLTTSLDERYGSGSVHHYETTRSEQGTVIQGAGSVQLQAGNDVALRAATVSAGDALVVVAGNDVRIEAGQTSHAVDSASEQKSKGFLSRSTLSRQKQTFESSALGSDLRAGGTLEVAAGRDLAVSASNLAAAGDTTLQAGRDLTLGAEAYTQSTMQASKSSKSGITNDAMTGINFNTSKLSENYSNTTVRQTGSSVSGDNVTLIAGRDATITASNVLADHDLAVAAGRNVDILAAVETSDTQTESKSSGFGFNIAAGLAPRQTLIGTNRALEDGKQHDTNGVTSILSANAGNLSIQAGLDKAATEGLSANEAGRVLTQGANLQAQGDVEISGRSVSLEEVNTTSQSTYHTQSSSMTLGAQLAGSVGSVITGVYDKAQAARKTDNDRLKGALVLKSGYDAAKLGTAASDGKLGSAPVITDDMVGKNNVTRADVNNGKADPNSGSAFGVSVNITSGNNKSDSANSSNTARGTNIQGDRIYITATDGDLHATGVKIQGTEVNLEASRHIVLEAASNRTTLDNSNSGGNYGVGVTVGLGSQNGISFQISASQTKGMASGSEVSYDNSLIEASERLTLKSGGDTTLQGAELKAREVSGQIGGNLNITTLQDQSQYESKQTSGGFSVSLCIPPICYGQMVSGNVNYSRDSINHNYQSAVGQSGIFAGEGGFNMIVAGHTALKGGALATTGDAADSRLKTGSLSYEDLTNAQSTKTSSVSVSASYGSNASGTRMLIDNAQNNALGNAGSLLAAGNKNGSESSQTLAFIQGQVELTGTGDASTDARSRDAAQTLTTRDAATANGALTNNVSLKDAEKLHKELQTLKDNAQAAQIVSRTMGEYVSDQRTALQKELKAAKTEEEQTRLKNEINRLNTAERVANVIIGTASGQTTAAVAQGLLSEAADLMRQETIENSGKFKGVTDKSGYVLSNLSGDSDGVNRDGVKTAGVRADLDIICGKSNERCLVDPITKELVVEKSGRVFFDEKAAGMSLDEFMQSKTGLANSGLTGGVQGRLGVMFGKSYRAGGFFDGLAESYGGSHDFIGGQISGLYDEQGNIKRGMSSTERVAYEAWSIAAIPVATPFALSSLLPPDVWNSAMQLVLKGVR